MERVAIAVLWYQGQFLIGQRGADKFLAGVWEFPGGKVEPEESPSEAAVRECKEETGLDVTVLDVCGEVTHRYPSGPDKEASSLMTPHEVHLLFYACRALDPAQPIKSPFCWMPAIRLSTLEFPATNTAILKQLARPDFVEGFWGTAD